MSSACGTTWLASPHSKASRPDMKLPVKDISQRWVDFYGADAGRRAA